MDRAETEIDFRTLNGPLERLNRALEKRLDGEVYWRKLGSEENLFCLRGLFQVTWAAYKSIIYLSSGSNASGSSNPTYRPEHAIGVPPLARSILDAAFNLVLLFDKDPRERFQWFRKAGWLDLKEGLSRARARFGDFPEHQPSLDKYAAELECWRKELDGSL